MTTRQLVDEYNLKTGKVIAKFSSRAAGEEAVRKARAAVGHQPTSKELEQDMEHKQENHDQHLQHKQAETEAAANVEAEEEFKDLDLSGDSQEESEDGESPVEKTKEQFAAEKQAARDAKKAEKDALKAAEKAKKLAEKPVDRSKAVAESWANPDVKAARCSRAGAKVTFVVNGIETKKEYESVNKAFTDLALPLSIHIGFRTKMRKEGRNIIEKDGVTYLFCCC